MLSVIDQVDRICAQFSSAIHNCQLEIYTTTLAVAAILFLIFPPRNDLDQI